MSVLMVYLSQHCTIMPKHRHAEKPANLKSKTAPIPQDNEYIVDAALVVVRSLRTCLNHSDSAGHILSAWHQTPTSSSD
jgi:hypothetical protein